MIWGGLDIKDAGWPRMAPHVLERSLPEKLAQLQALSSASEGADWEEAQGSECLCTCARCEYRREQNFGECDCDQSHTCECESRDEDGGE